MKNTNHSECKIDSTDKRVIKEYNRLSRLIKSGLSKLTSKEKEALGLVNSNAGGMNLGRGTMG